MNNVFGLTLNTEKPKINDRYVYTQGKQIDRGQHYTYFGMRQ